MLPLSRNFLLKILGFVRKILIFSREKYPGWYLKINNRLVKRKNRNLLPAQVLLLLPHCLQNDDCSQNVKRDIANCQSCGQCDIADIKKLVEKYGISSHIVSGGSLAREVIRNGKYKGIVAVACERELMDGINDVARLPVAAILNERPEGYCLNTRANPEDIEKAILFFLGENAQSVS